MVDLEVVEGLVVAGCGGGKIERKPIVEVVVGEGGFDFGPEVVAVGGRGEVEGEEGKEEYKLEFHVCFLISRINYIFPFINI